MEIAAKLSCIIWLALAPRAKAEGQDEGKLIKQAGSYPTLVNPACSHCVNEAKRRTGELRETDRVLAWTRGKYEGGAIPLRFFLVPYRVISDTYGVFVYDHEAGFMRGFRPSLEFSFYGWRNGIMVIRHKDGTLYSALSGRAFEGPRKGDQLKPVATLPTTWGYMEKAYPRAVAYRMFEKYKAVDIPDKGDAGSIKSRGPADPRLPPKTEVLGLSLGEHSKAYPVSDLESSGGVLTDQLGSSKVVILWYAPTRTAAVYSPVVERSKPRREVTLAFDPKVPTAPFVDRETGSRWGIEGRAVDGPLKGKTLRWLTGVQCRWFAWSTEYPETTIHGRAAGSK